VEEENNFPQLTYIFIIFYLRWYNFAYIVLNITVPVYDVGRSYENVRSTKSPENVWKRS